MIGTLDMVAQAAPRPPSELQPGIDPWLEAICLRCLAKDPADRFPDAPSLADALEAREAPSLQRRSPGGTKALVASLALLGAVAGFAWLAWGEAPGRGAPASPPLSRSPTGGPVGPALWERGPWGAKHRALGERADLDSLRARYELVAREASQIELREEAWTARRARALAISKRAAQTSDKAAAEWVRTLAVDHFYGGLPQRDGRADRCSESCAELGPSWDA